MRTRNLSTSLGEGRDAAPSLAHPSQKTNPVVYTEELTHLAIVGILGLEDLERFVFVNIRP